MTLLFWLFWILDVLLVLLIMAGSNFRTGFGANNDINNLAFLLLLLILTAGLVTKIMVKPKWVSLGLAALPILVLLVMYLLERKTGSP